jgi:hypothetical protein
MTDNATDRMQTFFDLCAAITVLRADNATLKANRSEWRERADRALDGETIQFRRAEEFAAVTVRQDGTIAELRNRVELQRKEIERLQAQLQASDAESIVALIHDRNVARDRVRDLEGRLQASNVIALIHDRNAAQDRVRELEAQLADVTPPAPTWADVQALMEGAEVQVIERVTDDGITVWIVTKNLVHHGGPTLAAAVAAATAKQEGAQ